MVGGELAFGVAMWDGGRWSALSEPVGSGLRGGASSFVVNESGDIYVGGSFTSAGDIAINNIAILRLFFMLFPCFW